MVFKCQCIRLVVRHPILFEISCCHVDDWLRNWTWRSTFRQHFSGSDDWRSIWVFSVLIIFLACFFVCLFACSISSVFLCFIHSFFIFLFISKYKLLKLLQFIEGIQRIVRSQQNSGQLMLLLSWFWSKRNGYFVTFHKPPTFQPRKRIVFWC